MNEEPGATRLGMADMNLKLNLRYEAFLWVRSVCMLHLWEIKWEVAPMRKVPVVATKPRPPRVAREEWGWLLPRKVWSPWDAWYLPPAPAECCQAETINNEWIAGLQEGWINLKATDGDGVDPLVVVGDPLPPVFLDQLAVDFPLRLPVVEEGGQDGEAASSALGRSPILPVLEQESVMRCYYY